MLHGPHACKHLQHCSEKQKPALKLAHQLYLLHLWPGRPSAGYNAPALLSHKLIHSSDLFMMVFLRWQYINSVWNELNKWKCGALVTLCVNKRYCNNSKTTWKLQTDALACRLCCHCCLMTCGWSPRVIEFLLLSRLSNSRISHSGVTFWPRPPWLEWHPNSEKMLQGWR